MESLYFDPVNWDGKKIAVICIPYGGGWSTIYKGWEPYFAPEIALLSVKFPGRGQRMEEAPHTDMRELVEQITPDIAKLDLPIIFYGGCFGGLCSYEIIKELEGKYGKTVLHFFSNSLVSPRYVVEDMGISNWPDQKLTRELLRRGELPEEIIKDEEVLEFLLPGIRADYRIYENYQYIDSGMIKTNLTMFYSKGSNIEEKKTRDWNKQVEGYIQYVPVDYDNLFATDAQTAIAVRINQEIVNTYLT